MPKYNVIVPIAGHIYVQVEASSEEEAIQKGMDEALTSQDIQYEIMEGGFVKGDVCYCPKPWKPMAEEDS